MSRLTPLSSREVIRKLKCAGFVPARSAAGSHQGFIKYGEERNLTCTVPLGNPAIPVGTIASILRQAHITREEWLEL